MTMPDDLDLTPDLNPADPQPVEEVTTEAVTTDTPEVEAAPAQPDPWEKINQLADLQRQQLELQMNQQRQAAAPPAPPAWVDPFERPENVAKLAELEERATWDTAAQRELNTLNRQLMREQYQHDLELERQNIRAEIQGTQVYQQAASTLRAEAAKHGDLVDVATLDEVEHEVLSTFAPHQRANALQDPALRKLLTEAAAGRRVLSGKQPIPTAPARPAAPPQVQSSARGPAAPKQGDPKAEAAAMWNDRNYLEGTMNDLLFGSKKSRTADHEELLS